MDTKTRKDMDDKNLYPPFPRAAVGVLILNRKNQVLLIKRGKAPAKNTWSVPGGSIELGETVFEAAARETFEETGIECTPLKIFGAVDAIYKDDSGKIKYHYVIVYVLATTNQMKATAKDDALDVKWFEINQIKNLNTPGRTYEIITKIIEEAKTLGVI